MTRKFLEPVRDFTSRLINRLIKKNGPRKHPKRYKASQNGIQREQISPGALHTCETLTQAGHAAFVVGGGVRDLLLGLSPKDFDIATDATPDQVRRLFRRSRIIGRRFQIVHVLFGRETIEVTTFRGPQLHTETDAEGRVLRDNAWGSQADDAARRDFTINAIYYDPLSDLLLDYHNGVQDLQARSLRIIGEPSTRYREDPVRMLRVARFSAKLGFMVEAETQKPLRRLSGLLQNVPQARLFDELIKLLTSGRAMACLLKLREEGLHNDLLPFLDRLLEQPNAQQFVTVALASTDQRIQQQQPISPGFLFATLLWHEVRNRWEAATAKGALPIPALSDAAGSVLDLQGAQLAIHKRYAGDVREIWMMQPRFQRRTGNGPYRVIEHLRFRAAYDFLLLRCQTGECPSELGQWWSAFAAGNGEQRSALMASIQPPSGTKKTRNQKKPGSPSSTQGSPSCA